MSLLEYVFKPSFLSEFAHETITYGLLSLVGGEMQPNDVSAIDNASHDLPLPPEILYHILRFVRRHYFAFESQFLRLSLVCRRWRFIIQSLALQSLDLVGHEIQPFLSHLESFDNDRRYHLRSLHFFISPPSKLDPCKMGESGTIGTIRNLIKLLEMTEMLKDLSISSNIEKRSECDNVWEKEGLEFPSLPELETLDVADLNADYIQIFPRLGDSKRIRTLRFARGFLSHPSGSEVSFPNLRYLVLDVIKTSPSVLSTIFSRSRESLRTILLEDDVFELEADFWSFLSEFPQALIRMCCLRPRINPPIEILHRIVSMQLCFPPETNMKKFLHFMKGVGSDLMFLDTNGVMIDLPKRIGDDVVPLDCLLLTGPEFHILKSSLITKGIEPVFDAQCFKTLRDLHMAQLHDGITTSDLVEFFKLCPSLECLLIEKITPDIETLPFKTACPSLRQLRIYFEIPEVTSSCNFFPIKLQSLGVGNPNQNEEWDRENFEKVKKAIKLGLLPELNFFLSNLGIKDEVFEQRRIRNLKGIKNLNVIEDMWFDQDSRYLGGHYGSRLWHSTMQRRGLLKPGSHS